MAHHRYAVWEWDTQWALSYHASPVGQCSGPPLPGDQPKGTIRTAHRLCTAPLCSAWQVNVTLGSTLVGRQLADGRCAGPSLVSE